MKDSLRALALFVVLVAAAPLIGQKPAKKNSSEDQAMPIADARIRTEKPKSYADSLEFDKTFKEFYPLVKPKESIRETAQRQVDRQLTMFIKQGIDSAEIVKVAYAGLDEEAAYKIYYETYRQKLTAKELKAYLAFLKTPEGAKIHAVQMELNRAIGEVNGYISKTVNANLAPMRSTLRDKMMKSQQTKDEKMMSDTTEAGKLYRLQMHVRDSIMKARGLDIKQQ